MTKNKMKIVIGILALLVISVITMFSSNLVLPMAKAESVQQDLLEPREEIDAIYSYARLNDTDCSVQIANKNEATRAVIPLNAEIDGVKYNIVEIALNGFMSSPKLKRVSISPKVKKIGNMAFANCSVLEKVTLSNVNQIGNYAFMMCSNLSEIVIPKSVEKIGSSIFRGNNTKVRVRAELMGINWETSWNSSNSNQDVEYGSKIIEPAVLEPMYQESTRSNTTTLVGFAIANGQPYSEEFYKNEVIHFPAKDENTGYPIISIEAFAFFNNNFKQLVIDYSSEILTIGTAAFYGTICENITINRPIDYAKDGDFKADNVFSSSTVKSIILPDNISGICDAMFYSCPRLKDIYFLTPQDIDIEGQEKIIEEQTSTGIVSLPAENTSFSSIGESAFAECNEISKLIIPANVEKVGNKIVYKWNEKQCVELDFIKDELPGDFDVDFLKESKCKIVYLKAKLFFDADGGQIFGDGYIEVKLESQIGAMPVPTFGNTAQFGGWYTEIAGEGVEYTADTYYTDDTVVILYAKWLTTITFNSDGGSLCDSITVVRGSTVTLPSSIKNNLSFRGWYTSRNGNGTQYTSSTPINSNITLYAKWAVHIRFNQQGGTGSGGVYATINVPMPKQPAPTRSGYKFMGYYTSSNGNGTKYYNSDMSSAHICNFTSDTTLYAYWQEKTFEECEVSTGVYELVTPNQLKALIGQTVNNLTINIVADINVGHWNGISKFSGTFNGNGHTITYTNTSISYGETFGFIVINNGTIKNVHFKPTIRVWGKTSSQGSAVAYVGGAVGENNGLIENVVVDKTVSSPYMNSGSHNVDSYCYEALWFSMGGVVGLNNDTVLNCTNNASLGGGESMGGIVGINNNNAEINGCVNNGNIYYDYATVATPAVGGIAATVRKGGSVKNCTNNAVITWAKRSHSDTTRGCVYMAQLVGQSETTAKYTNNTLNGEVTVVRDVLLVTPDSQLRYVKNGPIGYTFTA